ncbi:MAG: ABC transporter ATP-binding protein [Cryomorphaceae bacterium]|nr:MAG: ABC transporter ATP-binding protein [Cryomorphaceae bacterium]
MSEARPLLHIENLLVTFRSEEGTVRAVDDVSIVLHRGEIVGVVGESGSGKSVTSLSVMRLIADPPGKIAGGKITYTGRGGEVDLLSLPEREMRTYRGNDIAMIFQEPMTSLNPVMKCGKQVAEAIVVHQKCSVSEAREKTIALFKEVKLPRPEAMYDSYPHQLSGGQKQRVMIAMALSCEPSVLIADEPTTALDVTVQKTILELLRNLQKDRGMGVIFITHDLGVVAEIADRVVVMYRGKVVEEGPTQSIFFHPQHPYTRGLLACRPPLDRRLKRLPVIADFVDAEEKKSVEVAQAQLAYTVEEISAHHQKLYAQEPMLEIRNLQKWFPVRKGLFKRTIDHVKAVDDVTFSVYPGETLGLVGESGCGKTTLGRTILKLTEPTGGQILYRGRDITSFSAAEMRPLRKNLQIIFQDPYSSLNPRLTVGQALMEPMQVHGIGANNRQRREKVMELLEKVGLQSAHYNRYPHEFSGGQRQRVVIARTLTLNPEFIICDESVSALDVSVQAQVLNLLNDLKKEFNFTYIFISHDLSVVKFMSDRMVVMNQGRIEEMGNADEIYRNPQSEYTRQLIEAIPASNPAVER